MRHALIQSSKFCLLLVSIDQERPEETRAGGCPCGGVLHRADYPRKPRGCPMRFAISSSRASVSAATCVVVASPLRRCVSWAGALTRVLARSIGTECLPQKYRQRFGRREQSFPMPGQHRVDLAQHLRTGQQVDVSAILGCPLLSRQHERQPRHIRHHYQREDRDDDERHEPWIDAR